MALQPALVAQRKWKKEGQGVVPASIELAIGSSAMTAMNHIAKSWKQIQDKAVKAFNGPDIAKEFPKLKAWMEKSKASSAGGQTSSAIVPASSAGGQTSSAGGNASSAGGQTSSAGGQTSSAITPEMMQSFATMVANSVTAGIAKQQTLAIRDATRDEKKQFTEENKAKIIKNAAKRYLKENDPEDDTALWEAIIEAAMSDDRFKDRIHSDAVEAYKTEHEDDEEFQQDAQRLWSEENEDTIRDDAVEAYKNEHENDKEFQQDAKKLYYEENEESIHDDAVKEYKDDVMNTDSIHRDAVQAYKDEHDHEQDFQEEAYKRFNKEKKKRKRE